MKRKSLAAASMFVLMLSLSACSLFMTTGTIEITSYSEIYSDPSEIDPSTTIDAILQISPAIDGRTIFLTGHNGTLSISEVPPGAYTIAPIHCPISYLKSVTVKAGRTAKATVTSPAWTVYLYWINCGVPNPPLSTSTVRRALGVSIDRSVILTNLGWTTSTPAINFIPESVGTWSSGAAAIGYSASDAETLLGAGPTFNLAVTMTNITNATDYFAAVKPYLEAPTRIVTVSSSTVATFDELTLALASANYQLLRMGWVFDSNNLLPFYRHWFQTGNVLQFSSTTVDALLSAAQTALENGESTTYQDAVVDINAELVNEMPAIPLYWSH
jgi:ABC-type oligopeptide transport system substrate-binding subunit